MDDLLQIDIYVFFSIHHTMALPYIYAIDRVD